MVIDIKISEAFGTFRVVYQGNAVSPGLFSVVMHKTEYQKDEMVEYQKLWCT
jgi:uncharacterized cupin superfamily protein